MSTGNQLNVADMVCIFDEIDRIKAGHNLIYATGDTGSAICCRCSQRFRYAKDGNDLLPPHGPVCYDCTCADIFR